MHHISSLDIHWKCKKYWAACKVKTFQKLLTPLDIREFSYSIQERTDFGHPVVVTQQQQRLPPDGVTTLNGE